MRKIIATLLITTIKVYQTLLSPLFPPSCRYEPTCSQYAIDSLTKYRPFKAIILSIRRLLSCHPWSKGGYDPA
ncbi:MAG: membrane protein insertion efficiency factor YidD [Fidelibacterota bacterium]